MKRRLWLEETAGGRVRVGVVLLERNLPMAPRVGARLVRRLWRLVWEWRYPPMRIRR